MTTPAPPATMDGAVAIPTGDGSYRVILSPQSPTDPQLTPDERIMLQQAAALAASEERVAELTARLQRYMDRTAAAESALAEVRKDSKRLLNIAKLIADGAMPATSSGQTCFVPRYQIDNLRAAIGALLARKEGKDTTKRPHPWPGKAMK